MKRILLIACFAALCLGQQGRPVGSGIAHGWWEVYATQLANDGHVYHLRGNAELRGAEIVFHADQIDYDEDEATVHLAGHVTIETDTVALEADDVDYDVKSGEIQARPGGVKLKLKPAAAR